MKTILFQGDSITDAGRDYRNGNDLGKGYPLLVASSLGIDYPLEYKCYNRGVSGNRIVDVYARIKADIINLKPDYLSILIGVNDVWHEIGGNNGVDNEKFEKIYAMLLEEIYTALPDTKILILKPYVLNGNATCNTEEFPNRYNDFYTEVLKRAETAERVADKFNIPTVDLQAEFDSVLETVKDVTYLTPDGVHPTSNGHELIKRAWLMAFQKLK